MANEILIEFGILLFFAVIGGMIASRLKQPAVIGLLLIGAIIGPNALNIINDAHIIEQISELAVILLLFAIGLEFVLPKIMKVGVKALLFGLVKISFITFLTYETLVLFGFDSRAALAFGIIMSFSSTIVVVKILESKNMYNRHEVPLLMSILIIEDIFSILVLSFLSTVENGSGIVEIFEHIFISLSILISIYLLMVRFSKQIFGWLLHNSNEDTIMFLGLGLCAVFSYLSYYVGLSPSIGAFLAGSIIGSLPDVKQFHHAVSPYTSMFTALFFISMGTAVQFSVIKTSLPIILMLLLVHGATNIIAVGLGGYFIANFRKEQIIFSSITFFAASEFGLIVANGVAPLVPGIDIVSITATLIFISAIILSITISSYSKMFEAVDGMVPRDWKNSTGNLSDYIRHAFDEIDTENVHSRKFKKHLSKVFLQLLIMISGIIALEKVNGFVLDHTSPFIKYSIYFVFAAVMLFVVYRIFRNAKEAYFTLIILLSNLSNSKSAEKSRLIINNLFLVLVLLAAMVLTPVIVTFVHLPVYTNLFALVVGIVVAVILKRTTRSLTYFTTSRGIFPRYRKMSNMMPYYINKDE